MAHELVDTVSATPTGPVAVVLGGSVDVTGSFTLNGPPPAPPTASNYNLTFTHQSPGAPVSFGTGVNPASPNTDYPETCPAAVLNSVGAHTIVIRVLYTNDVPYNETFQSNIITIVVRRPFEEEQGAVGNWSEEQPASGAFTEEQSASGNFTEESSATGNWTEEPATSGNWTEERLED